MHIVDHDMCSRSFQEAGRKIFLCKEYENIIHANSVHEHEKNGGASEVLVWKSTLLQATEWRGPGCTWPLQRRCRAVKKDCTMIALYCVECEGKSED